MLDAIRNRRSCRKFDSAHMVEEEKINEIVNAGLYAANSMGKQNGVIIVITDKETRDRLSALNARIAGAKEGTDTFYGAPVVLLAAVKKGYNEVHDGAAMIQNMLVEATNHGLGSCWIHRAKEELESEEGRAILAKAGLDLNQYVGVGHAIIGYSELPTTEKNIKENRVFYIK